MACYWLQNNTDLWPLWVVQMLWLAGEGIWGGDTVLGQWVTTPQMEGNYIKRARKALQFSGCCLDERNGGSGNTRRTLKVLSESRARFISQYHRRGGRRCGKDVQRRERKWRRHRFENKRHDNGPTFNLISYQAGRARKSAWHGFAICMTKKWLLGGYANPDPINLQASDGRKDLCSNFLLSGAGCWHTLFTSPHAQASAVYSYRFVYILAQSCFDWYLAATSFFYVMMQNWNKLSWTPAVVINHAFSVLFCKVEYEH